MGVKFGVCLLYLLSFSAFNCNGYSGVRYFSEDPVSFDGTDANDEFYQINRIPQAPSKSPEDDYIPILYVPSWKDSDPKNSESYNIKKLIPNRKKRAASKRSADDDVQKKYDGDVQDLDSVKTIHFSSLFTPRFGRKRNNPQPINNYVISKGKTGLDSLKNPSTVYFDPRNGGSFKPVLGGRLMSYNKKQLTPRLGRSSEQNKVQLTAGSAFTPRLGRSENPAAVRLNAGRVFTPGFGRSEQQIQLNAGSAFTPRFGRSEFVDLGQMNSGEGFEGRLEGWNRMR